VAEFSGAKVQNERIRILHRQHLAEKTSLSATEKGTATHLFMQYCNFSDSCDSAWINTEKARLLEKAFLTQPQIEAVDNEKVLGFFCSDIGKLLLSAKGIEREFKFSVLVEANRYFDTESTEEVMLQGVVDCIIFVEGGLIVLDYKTDRIHPDQEAQRTEFYRPQLDAYCAALSQIYHQPILKKIVYYFETGNYCEL